MSTTTFDTHAAVKKLQAAGFSEQQAEVQIAVLADALGAGTATKQDITDLRRDLKEIETKLTRDIQEMEMRLTVKLGAMLVIAISAVATLVKLL
ncbi:MAG: DUF1640 domain-containing protein [Candidatus Competibacteraceae bacterium]